MDIPESKVHSFVIKLWIDRADETGQVAWHGYIIHVPDGKRRYLKKLGDILSFIEPYVGEMGVSVKRSKLRTWLKSWTRNKR